MRCTANAETLETSLGGDLLARGKLEAILAEDHRAGRLVKSRPNTVSRTHYANVTNVSVTHVSSSASDLFELYDALLVSEMRDKLIAEFRQGLENGTLPVKQNRVCRRWLQQQTGQTIPKNPLWDLFREFDRQILESNYRPSSVAEKVRKLREILADDCPLSPSRRHIAREELARRLGLRPTQLLSEPFRSPIREKSASLAAGKCLSPGEVMTGGKVRSFRSLLEFWPEPFVLQIADGFKSLGDTFRSGAKRHFQVLNQLLRFIQTSPMKCCQLTRESIHSNGLPTTEVWDDVLHAYCERGSHNLPAGKRRSWHGHVSALNGLVNHFATLRTLPTPGEAVRPGVPKVGGEQHRPSVAEVSREDQNSLSNFTSQALQAAAKSFNVKYDDLESGPFIQCLCEEATRVGRELPNNLPEAVLMILNRRLDLIGDKCKEIVLEGKAKLAQGLALRAHCTIPDSFICSPELLAGDATDKRKFIRTYFPEGNVQVAEANLLSLITKNYRSILPSLTHINIDQAPLGKNFFHSRYLEVGGRIKSQALLTPSTEMVAAAAILCQVETGMNPSVALDLDCTCMRPSEARGFTSFTGFKYKAGGKPIVSELRSQSFCIQTLQCIDEASRPLRAAASAAEQQRLFLRILGDTIKPLSEDVYRTTFKSMITSIDELAGLPLTPSMLRPSVLLKVTLENEGRMLAALAMAQHGENVGNSPAYQSRQPTRMLRSDAIRGFQHHFETVVVVRASELTPVDGYPEHIMSTRREELIPTGLGTYCRNRFGRPDRQGDECDELVCAGKMCPQMEVILTPQTAAQMQIWKPVLEAAAPNWERDQEERWLAVWLPWLCLISVVQEKSSRGPLLAVWDQGAEITAKVQAQEGYASPCLW